MLQEHLLAAHPTATTNDACRALPPSAMDEVMVRVSAAYKVELKLNVRANRQIYKADHKSLAADKLAINFVPEHSYQLEAVSPLRGGINVFHSASFDGRVQNVVASISRKWQRFCYGLPSWKARCELKAVFSALHQRPVPTPPTAASLSPKWVAPWLVRKNQR